MKLHQYPNASVLFCQPSKYIVEYAHEGDRSDDRASGLTRAPDLL